MKGRDRVIQSFSPIPFFVHAFAPGRILPRMGILLLIVAAFALMGGFHVVLYCALGCAVLFALFILPSMAITKLLGS